MLTRFCILCREQRDRFISSSHAAREICIGIIDCMPDYAESSGSLDESEWWTEFYVQDGSGVVVLEVSLLLL